MLKFLFIFINMENSSNNIFYDANAYIQNWNYSKPNQGCKGAKKVVFQQPYECVPDFYINNNFEKGNCDCVPKPKPKYPPKPAFPFDLKNILPLLTGLLKNNQNGISNILSALAGDNGEGIKDFDFSKILNLLGSSGFENLFTSFSSKKTKVDDIKSTDFEIKNYTRVE